MIDIIRPAVFEPFSGIHAFFTKANRQHARKANKKIEGLNFGINTSDRTSVVEKNRILLADMLDIDHNAFAIAEQVHQDNVKIAWEPGFFKNTDGLITQTPNLVLAIQVADCAAVFVADTQNCTLGVFHAGWRGASAKIVSKGIEKMDSLAEKKPLYSAYISPCISEKNFEVGYEVAEQFPSNYVNYSSYKRPHLNMKAYLKAELVDSGVKEELIEVSDECTVDNSQFYSYRRERDMAGRMLACMYMNKKVDTVCE